MPRPKPWIPRIAQIISDLKALSADKVTRGDIERIFQIGSSSAKQLMSVVGAELDEAKLLTLSRDTLLKYLECSPEGVALTEEARRRRRFAATLTQIRQEFIKEIVPLSETVCHVPRRLLKTRLKDLPQVTIEPGELRIRWRNEVDLASTLVQLASAMWNDGDKINALSLLIEQTPDARTSDDGSQRSGVA